ncbi:MAG: response regulator transcription factor [Candidatus Doudnabacteria bacterium]
MKALIIEDDPAVAKVVTMGLRNEHFQCDHTADGTTGLKMAVANSYDVIILDLILPGKTGDEICKQLRNANFNTVIIVLTALGDLKNKISMFGLGADDYMSKPFEFEELFARMKSCLRKQKIEIGNVLLYDDLTLDLKKHEVERKGTKIELRDKEIKILEYLMRHAEQVLTREMILNYVWGPSVERFTNVVDVHVHNLRDKIDKPFGTKIVRTVNNVGYKLKK